MADNFIPDNQFKPDAEQPAPSTTSQAPGFIPEAQFQSDEDKYGSPLEMAKTFGEQAASAASFGLSEGVETALGVNPEAIRLRSETNPITSGAGKVAGLVSSMATGFGEGALAAEAGNAVRAATGLGEAGASLISRAGANAVKQATEMAIIQGGDEVAKMFHQDPQQSAESIVSNVGLAALLGGTAGGVFTATTDPLWAAAKGSKLGELLTKVRDRVQQGEGIAAINGNNAGLYSATEMAAPVAKEAEKGIMKFMPDSLGGVMSMLSGASGFKGYLLGKIGKAVGGMASDEGKLALTKLLSTEGAIDSAGFKALYKATDSMYRAAKSLDTGVKAVFQTGASDMLDSIDHSKNEKLNQALLDVRDNPSEFLNKMGNSGTYMPEQSQAMGETVSKAAVYLNSLRPSTDPAGILDPKTTPSSMQEAQYQRALGIAQNPLMVLKHLKNGTLVPSDITTMQNVYPALLKGMQQKLTNQMIEHKDKGLPIPYHTRLNLSMMLGMPLDSSITPHSIMVNGMASSGIQQPQQSNVGHSSGSKQAFKNTSKIAQSAPAAREARRILR